MLKPLVLEFIASVGITFVMAFSRLNNTSDFFAMGITYFMIIGALSYAFKRESGAHFNPVLTISLIITRQIAAKKAVLYVIMQILGSIVGALLVFIAYKVPEDAKVSYYGEPKLHAHENFTGAFAELISMFLLVYVYNAIIADVRAPKHIFGVAIASVYLISVIAFGVVTGGCVNLVTLIGPSIFSNNFNDWLLYIAGQLLGGIVSGSFYTLFLKKNVTDTDDDEGVTADKLKAS